MTPRSYSRSALGLGRESRGKGTRTQLADTDWAMAALGLPERNGAADARARRRASHTRAAYKSRRASTTGAQTNASPAQGRGRLQYSGGERVSRSVFLHPAERY